MRYKLLLALASLLSVLPLGCSSDSDDASLLFELIVENVAQDGQFPVRVLFGPAVAVVHSEPNPIFTIGQPASSGLEMFAEDGAPNDLVTALTQAEGVSLVGVGDNAQPSNQGVLVSGDRFRIVLSSQSEQDNLSLVIGFLQANDLIVSAPESGIPLFDAAGNPISGDITGQFMLLDAGTEVNQPPGQGADQPPMQGAANTGAAEGGVVRPEDDEFGYPSVPSMLRITVNPLGEID